MRARAAITRRAPLSLTLALLATGAAAAAVAADEVIAPLAERIRGVAVIVEGVAGRGEASWDGSNPATIVTDTPFTVARVLKGTLPATAIVLRQPGGAVGGAELPAAGAAQFDDGERAFVFVGAADPRAGRYDVAGGAAGKYRITTDASGQAGLDVRLGVDAEAYSSKEKAPGTLLSRVPAEVFVRLAEGAAADSDRVPPAGVTPSGAAASELLRTPNDRGSAASASVGGARLRAALVVALAAIAIGAAVFYRRRRRGSAND